ncbi:MAG: hypothetical protein HWE14_02120 [Flavobacteriia bacterium]|nr:hypothetical protein [Flavobacteriia bacterium]
MKYLSILLFLFVNISFAQTSVYVYDHSTREPIPFADVIAGDEARQLSGWDGRAVFKVVDTSFLVYALGYKDSLFLIPVDTLWMEASTTVIQDVYVYSGDLKPDTILGNSSEEDEMSFRVDKSFDKTFRSGLLIEIDKPTVLYSYSFYVSRRSKRNSFFRFRLYDVDMEHDTIIGVTDIIDSSLVAQLECRKCWQKVVFPREILVTKDVLVAMEWIPEPGWVPDDDDEFESHDMACSFTKSTFPCRTFRGMEVLVPQCFESMSSVEPSDQYNMALFVDANILE